MSLTGAKLALEQQVRTRIESELSKKLQSPRELRGDSADYMLRRALEGVQEKVLNKYFGSYNNPKMGGTPALAALEQATEDRIVHEATLQLAQLQESGELHRTIKTKVAEMISRAIDKRCYEISDSYVESIMEKYDAEAVLLVETPSEQDTPQ